MGPFSQSILHDCPIVILWNCAHVINKSCPNWSGYMSSLKINDHSVTKERITMLPVINLHATDITALYSLLSFVTDQSSKHKVTTPSISINESANRNIMTWLLLIVKKLIQPFFHHLLGHHFIMGFKIIIRFKFGNN